MTFVIDFNEKPIEELKFTPNEFIDHTRKMISKIERGYSKCWSNRVITDDEAEIAPCENCKGIGCFVFEGKEINCAMDKSEGECYERVFDSEEFSDIMEQIMFGDDNFYELLYCNIKEESK